MRGSSTVRTVADFSVAGRSLRYTGVSWVIIGTLVGGVSTIGTVQTAYTHGVAACIFTFGSSLSCFLLGCFFAKALRLEGVVTVSEFLGRSFGQNFRYYSSILSSIGMFLHVVGQFLASVAILQSIFSFGATTSVAITLLLMLLFITVGGISGAGMVGKVKFYALYLVMLLCSGMALYKGGGVSGILADLPQGHNMLNFTEYGRQRAVADMLSMVVGVVSTQIYLQAIFAAKDIDEARKGAFFSALVIPPIGVMGIIVGLYLRAHFPDIMENSAQALPIFIHHHFPPTLAALFSAAILLAVLGTGSGLVLGLTTNIYSDLLQEKLIRPQRIPPLRLLRLTSAVVLLLAGLLVFAGLDSAILQWSYMSMGLRGATVFAGLLLVVAFGKRRWPRPLLWLLYCLPILYVLFSIR